MTTPAALRALAARVETEEPSAPLNSDVAEAFGWEPGEHGIWWKSPDGVWRSGLPDFLCDLTAAAGLMPEGWEITIIQRGERMECYADPVGCEHPKGPQSVEAIAATTEPRARTAAALRAMAAGMEAGE